MTTGTRRAAVAALALVLAAGCSSGGARSTGGGHAATQGSSGKTAGGLAGLSLSLGNSPNSLVLPLTPYVASGEQMTEQVTERNVLVSRCMQKSGFDYTPPAGVTGLQLGADPGKGTAYDFGITSMTLAQQYGYEALNPFFPAQQPPQPSGQLPEQLPAAEQAALTSCLLSLRKMPDMPHLPQLAQTLQEKAWNETVTGPPAQTLFKRWSACMAASGYDYANPVQAALGQPGDSDGPSQWSGTSPSQLEIQTAVADVTCKDNTGLLKPWIRMLAEDQEALVQHYLPQLQSQIAAYQQGLSHLQQEAST